MKYQQSYHQATIAKSISFVGVGLHSGEKVKVTLRPSVAARGIFFNRKDVEQGKGIIDARWYNVSQTTLSTVISNRFGASVSTVEHLMSALSGCGIDCVQIDIDGPEVPIMDGSAEAFVRSIKNAGKIYLDLPRYGIWIRQPVSVTDGDKYALLMPNSQPRITLCIDFPGTVIGTQSFSTTMSENDYLETVGRARTFGFAEQVDQLRSIGFVLGGSMNNAILVDGERILNPEGLRYQDEFVRHKVLDAIGDLALAGSPVMGHYYAYKAGHELNQKLLHKLFVKVDSWSRMSIQDGAMLFGQQNELYDEQYIQQALDRLELEKIGAQGL